MISRRDLIAKASQTLAAHGIVSLTPRTEAAVETPKIPDSAERGMIKVHHNFIAGLDDEPGEEFPNKTTCDVQKIVFSEFVRRQTINSQFSHWDMSDSTFLSMVKAAFKDAKTGYREGVLEVSVNPSGFFTNIVALTEGVKFAGVYAARQPGEEPRKQSYVLGGRKLPAKAVTVILYSNAVLAENNEVSDPTAHYEIINVNATPDIEPSPLTVGTLLVNHFHKPGSNDGGTSTGLSDHDLVQKLCESHEYWKDKGRAAPANAGTLITDDFVQGVFREQFGRTPGEKMFNEYLELRKYADEVTSFAQQITHHVVDRERHAGWSKLNDQAVVKYFIKQDDRDELHQAYRLYRQSYHGWDREYYTAGYMNKAWGELEHSVVWRNSNTVKSVNEIVALCREHDFSPVFVVFGKELSNPVYAEVLNIHH